MSASPGSSFAALALLAAVAAATPQAPNAGPDQRVQLGQTCTLAGTIRGRTPLSFWMADGNGPFEDMLVRYHDEQGVTAVGPLRMVDGKGLGWPGDLVRIDGRVHGVDVGQRRVYVVDLESGRCLAVTPQLSGQWKMLQSLAYDPEGDRLFAYDPVYGQLLAIALGSGAVTRLDAPGLNGRKAVRSLAFEPDLGLLYAVDSDAEVLVVIDPNRGVFAGSMELALPEDSQMEELQFFQGELYGLLGYLEHGELVAGQLLRINLASGGVSHVGPIVRDVSPHALLIESVPTRVTWRQVEGPARAQLDFASTVETEVHFTELGTYVFELTAYVGKARRRDRVEIEVVATDCNANGVPDHEDLARGVSLDRNLNGVLDECELARGYVARFGALDAAGWVSVTVVPRMEGEDGLVPAGAQTWLRDAVLFRTAACPFVGHVLGGRRRYLPFDLRSLHPSLRRWGALTLDGRMVGVEMVLGLWHPSERQACVMPGDLERGFRLTVSL